MNTEKELQTETSSKTVNQFNCGKCICNQHNPALTGYPSTNTYGEYSPKLPDKIILIGNRLRTPMLKMTPGTPL